MTKYVLDMRENGWFVVFVQDENNEDINDWFSQGDLNQYKKWNHTDERKKKYEDVVNWLKIEYPELLI